MSEDYRNNHCPLARFVPDKTKAAVNRWLGENNILAYSTCLGPECQMWDASRKDCGLKQKGILK